MCCMTQITLRYFAAAADAAGREEEAWMPKSAPTLDELREHLRGRYGNDMDRVLRSGSFLVNGIVRCDGGAIAASDDTLTDTVTVDVLPAFAGG